MEGLYHIARRADWEAARESGGYRVSTLGRTLDGVGSVHLSFAGQVSRVADFPYAGTPDLVLLRPDPATRAGHGWGTGGSAGRTGRWSRCEPST